MTIQQFRELCINTPHLAPLWEAMVRCALEMYAEGLPLALEAWRDNAPSEAAMQNWRDCKAKFDRASSELRDACAKQDIQDIPVLSIEQICALYR